MSDDLVKRLRDGCSCAIDSSPCMAEEECRDAYAAADRIEELEERLEKEMQDLDAADRRAKRLQVRIEELEAKLAKAIGDLGRLSRAEVFGDGGAWGMRLSEDALGREILARMKFARTTLAAVAEPHKLTGGKDE